MSYKATVERDGRVWLVRVEGVGATQARHLRELDDMTIDLIAVMTDTEVAGDDIDYQFVLPESVSEHLDRAATLREQATAAQSQATVELRAAARELAEGGDLPMRDIGRVLHVSHQRVHQLLSSDG